MDKEHSSLPNTDADGGDNDDFRIASHEEKMPLDASAGRGGSAHGNPVDSDASYGPSAGSTGANDSSEAESTPESGNADENIANSSDGQGVEVAQNRPQEPARSQETQPPSMPQPASQPIQQPYMQPQPRYGQYAGSQFASSMQQPLQHGQQGLPPMGQYYPYGQRPQPQYGQYAPTQYHVRPGAVRQPQPKTVGKAASATVKMKTWQFVLAMVGSAVVGVIILFFIAGMIAGYTQAGANGGASGSSSTSTGAGDSQSKPQSDDSQSNESQSGDSDQTKQDQGKADPVITSITVKYTGTTAIGTEINDSTPGIAVTAKYDNGSTRPVGSGYTVKNPGKLEAGQTQTFTVSYKGLTADFTVKVEESDDQFKASTQDVPFDDLARNPDANKGKRVHFRGQIKQVIEASSNIVAYRISVEQDAYGYWTSDKVIYVTYIREGNDNRLLENDIVELWGTSGGTITYKSAMGGDITIPSVVARIMQLSQ